MILLRLLIILLVIDCTGTSYAVPSTSDYDAYGLKVAANDQLLVLADNEDSLFYVQLAPFNNVDLLGCVFYYDISSYVYSVGFGEKQNSTPVYFFFAGGTVSSTDFDDNGTFIGILFSNDSMNAQMHLDNNQTFDCNLFNVERQFISSYVHQEYFVFVVEPYGQYAIGLAKDFAFIYNPFSTNNVMTIKNSSDVWPNDKTFIPLAADIDISYTIVAGFVQNTRTQTNTTLAIYVMSNSNLMILTTWTYTPSGSERSDLNNIDFSQWSNDNIMSVDINPDDHTRVLVGVPFLLKVFLFVVGNNGASLTSVYTTNNNQPIGFGKSVSWLSISQAAILLSSNSSLIYLYTSLSNTTLPLSPSAILPNPQQPITETILNPDIIRTISTPRSLVLLDVTGYILVMSPAPPGYYASTNTIDNYPLSLSNQPSVCIAGTYKSDTGIHPCSMCPNGTRNPGNIAAISCISCSMDTFCPFGAVIELNPTLLQPDLQAYTYPRSPESVIFDEILIQNMFKIGSGRHCIVVAPIFWVCIVIGIILIPLCIITIIQYCVKNPKVRRYNTLVQKCFRQFDLVRDGELWIGGLISVAIIVLLSFAYSFSNRYYNQYPAEKVGPSTFACDETIRNAKYDSSLQLLIIPVFAEETPMFNLLDNQPFTLHLDLLNTMASCNNLSVQDITESVPEDLNNTCTNSNGILSASVELSGHLITVQWTLASIEHVGAVRVGLSGEEYENGSNTLKQLNSSQAIYSMAGATLHQTVNINLQLTKVINNTEPLASGESEISGTWYLTFSVDKTHTFTSVEDYTTPGYFTLTISISEGAYYVQNLQQPIAKRSEVAFHCLLFTIVCLEIVGLFFLILKLTLIPLLKRIAKRLSARNPKSEVSPTHSTKTSGTKKTEPPRTQRTVRPTARSLGNFLYQPPWSGAVAMRSHGGRV